MTTWSSLPEEVFHTIFSFLTCRELSSAVCANSTWNLLANNDIIWKEAIFNGSFPHHFSFEQKDIPWRQVVKRHFETKRNLINRSCVQFTLGTRCPTSKPESDFCLRRETSSGKYCLLVWEIHESRGFSYSSHNHVATELWDLETRTIKRTYSQLYLELFNDYLLQEDGRLSKNASVTRYANFDPSAKENLVLDKRVAAADIDYRNVSDHKNSDPNSHLLLKTWSDSTTKQKFVLVFDLRTGSKILEKTYDDAANQIYVDHFYCSKILLRYSKLPDLMLVLDALTQNEISITEPNSTCTMIVGNNLWLANAKEKCLIKHNFNTMQRQKYDIDEDISNVLGMSVFNGIIWLYMPGLKCKLVDVSSSKCRVLAQMAMPISIGSGQRKPHISLMPNGALLCTSASFAYVLSFRDDDIEWPIQILQIEPTGINKLLNMRQGDLNSFITKNTSVNKNPLLVSSQTVLEDATQRYCVIFSYSNTGNFPNSFVNKMYAWRDGDQITDYKTKLFTLVYFDYKKNVSLNSALNPQAFGPCWVFYETKVNGGWQRASPVDQWTFFKAKLGLK